MTVTAYHLNQRIVQAIRKDEADYRRLVGRVARLGVAFDEGEAEELTTDELARRVLKKLGIEIPTNGNSVEKLSAWLDGHERASDRGKGVRSATDAADEPQWFTEITKR